MGDLALEGAAAVLCALGGPTDLRTAVRVAADTGLSDQSAVGALRSLYRRGYVVQTTRGDQPSYWHLSKEGAWIAELLETDRGRRR